MNTITKLPAEMGGDTIPGVHPRAVRPTPIADHPDRFYADPEPPRVLMPVTAPQLLRKAGDIMEQRAKEYDKPEGERSVAVVVTALNAIVGRDALTEAEGWLFMALLKKVRLFSAKSYHADSGLDGIAYTALMAEAKAREQT